jgi:hypothetical protein
MSLKHYGIGLLRIGWLIPLFLTIVPLSCLAQQPACQIFVVSGKVEVKGQDRETFINSKGNVRSGEEVRLASDATIAYLNVGARVERLEPSKVYRVDCGENAAPQDATTERFARLIDRLLVKETTTSSPLGYKGGQTGSTGLKILLPRGQTNILDNRPTFLWNLSSGVFEISLLLQDEDTVLWRRIVSGVSSLQYPSEKPALEPDKKYTWEVKNLEDPSEDDSATFHVSTTAEQTAANTESEKIRSACNEHHLSKENCSLILAGFYNDRGFPYEAVQELMREQEQGVSGKLVAPLLHQLLQSQ